MNNIDLIGKHLNRNNLQTKLYSNIDEICAFTGISIDEGIKLKDVIGSSFTDHSYIKHSSEFISVNTALCLQSVIKQEREVLEGQKKSSRLKLEGDKNIIYSGLRNYHFYCTENELKLLKREHLEDYILQHVQLEPPFILAINYSQKKHISFKSKINYSKGKSFVVSTDRGNVNINISKLQEVYPIMKNWYEIVKGKETTSQQPTYFTKDDILNGCDNLKRITDYGINRYSYENEIISKFRNTGLLELLVFILNKKGL